MENELIPYQGELNTPPTIENPRINFPMRALETSKVWVGLKDETNKTSTETDPKKSIELRKQGWLKVRSKLDEIRNNKDAGFLYSSKITDHEFKMFSYQQLLIYPQTSLKQFLIVLQSALILYVILIVPFRYAFNQNGFDSGSLFITDVVVDLTFLVISISHFFYVFIDNARYVTHYKSIAYKYMFGIFELDSDGFFIVDILATFPYYLDEKFYYLRFFRLLQLGLVLRGFRLVLMKIFSFFTSNINFSKSLTDIIKFLLILFMIAQYLACFWYILGSRQHVYEGFNTDTQQPIYMSGWVHNLLFVKIPGADFQTIYITSLYWVFTTLTTVGYGDYYGVTSKEYLFTMVVEFLGVFVFAYMMGNINVLFERLDVNAEQYIQDKNDELDQWLIMMTRTNPQRQFSEAFVEDLRMTLNMYWSKDHSSIMRDDSFFKQIPHKLQKEVFIHYINKLVQQIFGKFILNFAVFFEGLDEQFIQDVVNALQPKRFLVKNGDVEIIPAGTCSNEILFITKGRVAISTKTGDKFLVLPPRSYFGEHLVLFNIKSSNVYVTHGQDVECMCIPKETFLQLCKVYPQSKKLLKSKALIRRRHIHELLISRELARKENLNTISKNDVDLFNFSPRAEIIVAKPDYPYEIIDLLSLDEDEIEQSRLKHLAKTISNNINHMKSQVKQIEKDVTLKMAYIKVQLEMITKFDESSQKIQGSLK